MRLHIFISIFLFVTISIINSASPAKGKVNPNSASKITDERVMLSQLSVCGEKVSFSGTATSNHVIVKYSVEESPGFQSSDRDRTGYSRRISSLSRTLGINSSARQNSLQETVQLKPNEVLQFEQWTYGDNVNNIYLPNLLNERWLKIQGTNTWIPNGVIQGNPPSNPSALLPNSCRSYPFIHGAVELQNNYGQIVNPSNSDELFPNPTESHPLQGFKSPLKVNTSIAQGPNGKYSHHGRTQYAIDLAANIGTPVFAMRAGKVVFLRDIYPDTGGGSTRGNEFNTVVIEHDGDYRSAYLHLEQGFIRKVGIHEGDRVSAGQLIGYSGNSGWSTGPHLHIEVYKGFFGHTVPFEIEGVFRYQR